jgi:hypothetical protein
MKRLCRGYTICHHKLDITAPDVRQSKAAVKLYSGRNELESFDLWKYR